MRRAGPHRFHYEWSLSILIFAIHVALLGYLVARSGYIPRIMGVLLMVAGVGYVINYLRPYLYPDLDLGFLFVAFFGEFIFAVWLLVRGRKIPEPVRAADAAGRYTTLRDHQ